MSNPSGYKYINDDGSDVNFIYTSTVSSATGNTASNDTDITENIANRVNNVSLSSTSKPMPDIDPTPPALFTLPNGQLIDGKNTLQSFDGVDVTSPAGANCKPCGGGNGDGGFTSNSTSDQLASPLPELRLPDGRLIDGKNTLQSFAAPALQVKEHEQIDTSVTIAEQHHSNTFITVPLGITSSTGDVPYVEEGEAIHAEGVAVVDADILDRQVAPSHRSKKRSLYWLAFVLIIGCLIVGIATACGTGNCGNSPSPSPSASKSTIQASMSPTTAYDQSIAAACNFLNSPIISECQNLSSFSRNTFGDSIPTEIGLLTQLTNLELDGRNLTGSIPSTLGELTLLINLDLNKNQLTGTIPSTFGNLTQLTELRLHENQFTSTIPSTLGNLVNLTSLRFADNQLNGTIPSNLGNLTQLIYLRLHSNQLTGTIPSTLGNFPRLILLSLYSNQLSGSIPSTLGNLTQLETMWLHENQLNGTIPSSFGGLTLLDDLSFRSNQLTGTIPSSLGELTKLTRLALFNNSLLTGTIPSTLCPTSDRNTSIRIDCANIVCSCCFAIYGNTSCPANAPTTTLPNKGPIPTVSFPFKSPTTTVAVVPTAVPVTNTSLPTKAPARLVEEELSVACNFLNISNLSMCQATTKFEGRSVGNEIPTELGLLTQLSHLSLNENQLIGTIPSSLGNLQQLTVLYLSTNQLTGTIPFSLGHLVNLTDLSLFENELTGTIPSSFGNLTRLTYLDFGGNPLNGTVPSALCSTPGIDIYVDCSNITCVCCADTSLDSCS